MEQVLAALKIKKKKQTGLQPPFCFNVDSNRKILRGGGKAIFHGTEKDFTFSYPHADHSYPTVTHTNIDLHQRW